MRKLIFNLHLYSALFVGVFVVVLGLTGSVMVFEDDLDRLLHPELLHVTPNGKAMSPAEAMGALSALYPGQSLGPLQLPARLDMPYSIQIKKTQIFLNPYTGKLSGTRKLPTGLQMIHSTHISLMRGAIGKAVVTGASMMLVWFVGSGIYLWWPRKRATIKISASYWRIAFDFHNTIGIYSALFLFAAGLSGVIIHFDNDIARWVNRSINSVEPVRRLPSTPREGVPGIGIDAAIRAATDALPGTVPIMVRSPKDAMASYFVALRHPEDLTPGGRSWAVIDQYSGKALFVEDSRKAPLGTWAFHIQNRAIHTGDIFGYPSKILMSLSCLLLIVLPVTGYYMWWKKSRHRDHAWSSGSDGDKMDLATVRSGPFR
jgi:uncharacterized iron-regulated membrane protein